jgi:hypothetical protein
LRMTPAAVVVQHHSVWEERYKFTIKHGKPPVNF